MNRIHNITKFRIEKHAAASMLFRDEHWYQQGELLGLVAEDVTDHDYYAAVFKDDGAGRWRPARIESNIRTRQEASKLLAEWLKQ